MILLLHMERNSFDLNSLTSVSKKDNEEVWPGACGAQVGTLLEIGLTMLLCLAWNGVYLHPEQKCASFSEQQMA